MSTQNSDASHSAQKNAIQKVWVQIKVLEHGKGLPLPKYETTGSAGMDVVAAVEETMVIEAGKVGLVPTGLKVAIPEGFEIQVRPRSGLALKKQITLLNTPGTIDSDYRGELKIIVANLGTEDFEINRGDRIAQIVLSQVPQIDWNVVEELDATVRGEGGFGHTGQ